MLQQDAADVRVAAIGRQMERRVAVALRDGVDVAALSYEKLDTVVMASIRGSVKGQGTRFFDGLVDVRTVPDKPIADGDMSVAGGPVQRRCSVRRAPVVDVTSVQELLTYGVQVSVLGKFNQLDAPVLRHRISKAIDEKDSVQLTSTLAETNYRIEIVLLHHIECRVSILT